MPQPAAVGASLDNVIARGGAAGVLTDDNGDAGDNIQVTLSSTNYSSVVDDPSAETTVTLGAGNQTAEPLFANPALGDFRQKPGSATIDKGAAAGAGALDFEGQPRLQGPAVDIGADEATDPASLLTLTARKKKIKPRRKVEIPATCPLVDCNVAVAPRLVIKDGRARASAVVTLKTFTVSLKAGVAGSVTVTLKKKLLKRVRSARKAKLSIAATAIDSLGFVGNEGVIQRFKSAAGNK